VQNELTAVLTDLRPAGENVRLISICAGDGRDLLPVLASHAPKATALLVELHPELAERARATAAHLRLLGVEVRTADAGWIDPYLDIAPVHVVLACGVFGNITVDDAKATIATMPHLLVPGGVVIWTRGRADDGTDPSRAIRALFEEHGFVERSFTAPGDARFGVGVHHLHSVSGTGPRPEPGRRLFTFV
jgi:hypothetical protein